MIKKYGILINEGDKDKKNLTNNEIEHLSSKILNELRTFIEKNHQLSDEDVTILTKVKKIISKYTVIEEEITEEVEMSKETFIDSNNQEIENIKDKSESIKITENEDTPFHLNVDFKVHAPNLNLAIDKLHEMEDNYDDDMGMTIHMPLTEKIIYNKDEAVALLLAEKKGYSYKGITKQIL